MLLSHPLQPKTFSHRFLAGVTIYSFSLQFFLTLATFLHLYWFDDFQCVHINNVSMFLLLSNLCMQT